MSDKKNTDLQVPDKSDVDMGDVISILLGSEPERAEMIIL